eukprot:557176-Pelagomonas_calceolata.AAC.11
MPHGKQRQEASSAKSWACPTRGGIGNEDKLTRKSESREELFRVTWMPSWEPEETRATWPVFHWCMQELESSKAILISSCLQQA